MRKKGEEERRGEGGYNGGGIIGCLYNGIDGKCGSRAIGYIPSSGFPLGIFFSFSSSL